MRTGPFPEASDQCSAAALNVTLPVPDPHSPRDGAWWSHMGWLLWGETMHNNTRAMAKYAPDLAKDRFYVWLNNYHWISSVVLAVVLYAIGGLPLLLWGGFFRIVFGLHATWLVNSATHMWGAVDSRPVTIPGITGGSH